MPEPARSKFHSKSFALAASLTFALGACGTPGPVGGPAPSEVVIPTPVDPAPTPTPVDPAPTPTPVDPTPAPTPTPSPSPAPTTYAYAQATALPYRVSESQGRVVNGKLYVFGGFDSLKACCVPTDRAYVYDGSAWAPVASMPDGGATHVGVTTDGARYVYLAGGYIADASRTGQIFGTRAVWRYDTTLNRYDRLRDLPIERAAGQLELVGGKLHYFGGTNLARTQDVADHYVLDLDDPGANWTTAAPLPNPRHHMGSVVLGGFIYAVGGQKGHDGALVTQASVDRYDPARNEWTAVKSLPFARGHVANSTFVLGGRIVVAGGETAHTVGTADVVAYDPDRDEWAPLTALPSARISGVAAPLGPGFVFAGGMAGGDGSKDVWSATPR